MDLQFVVEGHGWPDDMADEDLKSELVSASQPSGHGSDTAY
jgi:hypothetical protein